MASLGDVLRKVADAGLSIHCCLQWGPFRPMRGLSLKFMGSCFLDDFR